MNVVLPLAIGLVLGDVWGTLILVGLARLVVNHNVTFFINSLAHYWGTRPYTEENSARDNGFLAFLTYGEGYHNYHHIFQTDYRNGIRWWQWDPTKWMIFSLNKLGLANDLVKVDEFKIQRAIMDTTFKRVRAKLDTDEMCPLRAAVEREYQAFLNCVKEWRELQAERYEKHREALGEAWNERRTKLVERWDQTHMRDQLKVLEQSLHKQQKRLQIMLEQLPSPQAA
jgi:stearoyl-CoA desaturase (delta-9 desaturase)